MPCALSAEAYLWTTTGIRGRPTTMPDTAFRCEDVIVGVDTDDHVAVLLADLGGRLVLPFPPATPTGLSTPGQN